MRSGRGQYRIAIGAAFAALLFAVILMAANLLTQLRTLSTDSSDNMRWSITQLDTEFANLSALLSRNLTDPESVPVRLRADIALSRLNIVRSGRTAELFAEDPSAQLMIAEINAFADAAVVILDDPDGLGQQDLRELRDLTEGIRPTIRRLALLGVRLGSENASERRAEFARQLSWTGGTALALMLAMGVLLLILDRLLQRARERDAELLESSKQLQTTISAAQDGILQVDHTGRIINANHAAAALFGWRADEVIGQPLEATIFPDTLQTHFKMERERFDIDGMSDFVDAGLIETSARRAKGEEFPLEISLTSVTEGGDIRYIAYLRDISERKINEQRLIDARDRAESTDRAKSRFLAVMSHEMRTPLNGVLGVLDLLKTTRLSKQQTRYVEIATASGEVLLEHVNEALDVTRAETDSLMLSPHDFDLGEMIEGVVNVLAPLAEEKALRLTHELEPSVRGWFHGDGNRIRQIVTNLIGNAIKFTNEGGISVTAECINAPQETMLTLSVTDSGPGISAEMHERVFDDFVAGAQSGGRQSRGDGLGLAISRRIARQMGGELTLCSEAKHGATFRLTVPLLRSKAPVISEMPSVASIGAPDQPRRVLVVEDNSINRKVLTDMLHQLGHTVTEAVNGKDGLEKADAEPFDIIFMDISMPVMDGIEATRRLRQESGPNRKTRVIGLTAHGGQEYRSIASEAGMDAFYSKPIRLAVLRQLMHSADSIQNTADPRTPAALDELKEALGAARVQESITQFFEEVDAFIAAAQEKDGKGQQELAELAHRNKGAAALFGFDAIEVLLADIETLARNGAVTVDTPELAALGEALGTARGQMAAE